MKSLTATLLQHRVQSLPLPLPQSPATMSAGTTESPVESLTIRPINKGVVHKICAGQVILDLSAAVKELVENSLDAGATSIEISLKDYGEEWFQVIDNGCGISPCNFKALALKHHTSKLADFTDLQSLTTFGFRGEALSSLCSLGNLTVETRTKNEPVATHLTFNHSGLLVAEKKTARQVGTSVNVKKLFSNLPVRSKEFSRNIRKEYGKLVSLLNAYALIAKGVRLVCTNMSGKNARSVVLKTQGSGSLKDNIIILFGMNTFNCLEPINISMSENCKVEGFVSKAGYGSGRNLGDRQFFYVNGRPVDMPKVGKLVNELYRGANSRQYPIVILNFIVPSMAYDVNVTPDKRKIFFSDEGSLLQTLREALGTIYSADYVTYSVKDLKGPDKKADLTYPLPKGLQLPSNQLSSKQAEAGICKEKPVTEDKIIIDLAESENKLLSSVEIRQNAAEKSLDKDFRLKAHTFENAYSCSAGQGRNLAASDNSDDRSTMAEKDTAVINSPFNRSKYCQSSLSKFVTLQKRKHENISTPLSEVPVLRNERAHHCSSENHDSELRVNAAGLATKYHRLHESDRLCVEPSEHFKTNKGLVKVSTPCLNDSDACVEVLMEDTGLLEKIVPLPEVTKASDSGGAASESKLQDSACDTQPSRDSSMPCALKISSILQFNIKNLMERRQQKFSLSQSSLNACQRATSKRPYTDATLELSRADNEEWKDRALAAATTELERLFKKRDFGRMKVLGQFNLGFIIGKLDQDLFIVDQHAADEKYNFEHLSQSTIMNQQPLLRPITLELSPEEEIVASMHMDIIRKNGFSLEEDAHAASGYRFKLKAVPFSKNVTFGVEDVKELISTLSDGQGECSIMSSYRMDTTDSICPSRVRAMLASRACKSSVRIGDALGRNEMQKILEHLAELKSPWNCPHGRPTMRHLVDLSTVHHQPDPDETIL